MTLCLTGLSWVPNHELPRLPPSGKWIPTTAWRLHTSGWCLPASAWSLPSSSQWLPSCSWGLPPSGRLLPTSSWRLPSTGRRLPAAGTHGLPTGATPRWDILQQFCICWIAAMLTFSLTSIASPQASCQHLFPQLIFCLYIWLLTKLSERLFYMQDLWYWWIDTNNQWLVSGFEQTQQFSHNKTKVTSLRNSLCKNTILT